MRTPIGLAVICVAFFGSVEAKADTRRDEAKALRDEIALSGVSCKVRPYASCFNDIACNTTLDALTDYQLGLNDPATQGDAVGQWRRFVGAKLSNAECMRGLLRKDLYCRAVNLVKKFDPHLHCPASGKSNGSCWVNEEDDVFRPVPVPPDALVEKLAGKERPYDWTQGCKFVD
jgi:hypothetical protein